MPDEATSEELTVETAEQQPEGISESVDPWNIPQEDLLNKIYSAEEAAEAAEAEQAGEYTPDEPEDAEVEAQAETAEEEQVETPDPEPETPEFSEVDELRAALEVQEAQTKHFEALLGRHTGNEGFQQQRAERLEAELAEARRAQAQPTDEYGEEAPVRQAPRPPQQQAPSAADSYLVALAIKDAGEGFIASTPDLFETNGDGERKFDVAGNAVVDPAFMEAVKASQDQIQRINQIRDPLQAGEQMKSVLNSAWASVQRKRKLERLDFIRKRRADQAKSLKDKKRAESASSVTPAGRPRKRAVDPFKLPIEEVRKRAQEEAEKMGMG